MNFVHLPLAHDDFCNRILLLNKSFVAMIAGKSLFVLLRPFHAVWYWKTHSIDNTFFGITDILFLKQFKELLKNKLYFK